MRSPRLQTPPASMTSYGAAAGGRWTKGRVFFFSHYFSKARMKSARGRGEPNFGRSKGQVIFKNAPFPQAGRPAGPGFCFRSGWISPSNPRARQTRTTKDVSSACSPRKCHSHNPTLSALFAGNRFFCESARDFEERTSAEAKKRIHCPNGGHLIPGTWPHFYVTIVQGSVIMAQGKPTATPVMVENLEQFRHYNRSPVFGQDAQTGRGKRAAQAPRSGSRLTLPSPT